MLSLLGTSQNGGDYLNFRPRVVDVLVKKENESIVMRFFDNHLIASSTTSTSGSKIF